jgi:PilZ domain
LSKPISDVTPLAANETPRSLGADRRVWVRYSCDLESTCHSTRGQDELSWSARVRDISRGGVNLQVNRLFEPGSFLRVDLPLGSDMTPRSLQVKVIHAHPQGPGKWSLGCAFDKPLAEEDLLTFQVKQAAPAPDEKRAWIRFSCDGERPAQATLLINPSNRIQAKVLNISPGGVGLATKRHCEPGTPLKLELIDASGRSSRPMQVRVVHSNPKGNEDWVIGCQFDTPLSEEDVAALL